MKKLLIGIFIMLSFNSYAQQEFYYYKGGKLPMQVNTQFAYLLSSINNQEELQKKLVGIATVTKFHQDIYQKRLITTYKNSSSRMASTDNYYAEIQFTNTQLSISELQQIMNQIRTWPEIINLSHSYNINVNNKFSITNYIWVELKNENQMPLLISEVDKINYSIVGQNPYMKEWVMVCPKENASISQIRASQVLVETGLFSNAEPEFIGGYKTNCTNDPLITNQWAINNTGQFGGTTGMDTRVCNAHTYTTGSVLVDIAIIDEGFENNHPDLDGNLANTGYDTKFATTPTVVYGSHGTACAGIAAAEGNNSLGVSGVAYNSDLMSVAMDFNTLTNAQIADGFNWSRLNGAEVMSNSWGGGASSSIVNTSITNALTLGRGGLGCVVLFATANDNLSAIEYPANSNEKIIAVGAMSPCGERKNPSSCDGENWWGSNYGAGLDVMAPGVLMYTTDRQGTNGYNSGAGVLGNYTSDFNGTSSATPHAAGVAALILSVNPCLTTDQVEDIMQRTSRKVGGYSYTVNGLYPNGTWNNQMGYGLLDAEAAVKMAGTMYLQNLTQSGTDVHKGWFVKAGSNVNPFITSGNYTTTTSANISINAQYDIDFQPGCDLRGKVDAVITSPGACSTW